MAVLDNIGASDFSAFGSPSSSPLAGLNTGGFTPLSGALDAGGGDSSSFLGGLTDVFNADVLKGFGSLAGGIGGIMGVLNAGDQLDFAKDQFGFQQDFANRNLANQGQLVNNKIINDKRKHIIASGGDPAKAEQQARAQTQDKRVDVSAIG